MPDVVIGILMVLTAIAYIVLSVEWFGSSKEYKFSKVWGVYWYWLISLPIISCTLCCWLIIANKESNKPEPSVNYYEINNSKTDEGCTYQYVIINEVEKNVTNIFGKYYDTNLWRVKVTLTTTTFCGVNFQDNGSSAPTIKYNVVRIKENDAD